MNNLIFPKEVLKQHLCVLGKTGSGKSSALRYVVEYLLDQGKRVCIIDPKGDWGGLKVGGDGKSPGYPVIGFGDFKEPKAQDVPINDQSGKNIAELIAGGNRPCVIGFRGWTQGAMIRFWIDFASTLFNTNSGELYLVGDEFHNFAPKGKILDPAAGKCLHWSNRVMSEGRGLGIVCLIASQRPQKVHNDTLTCCETLIAMRVIHKADRDAIEDWIDGCGDREKGKEVLNSLAGMDRGEAYVWSPEIGFGPKRLTFPMFKTFDSFAPPQLQKAVSTSGWSTVDLSAVKDKLAAVIEEHKQNDPAELKRRIRFLEKEHAEFCAKTLARQDEVKTVEKPVPVRLYTQQDVSDLLAIQDAFRRLHPQIDAVVERSREIIDADIPTVQQVQKIYRAENRPASAMFLNERHEFPRIDKRTPVSERTDGALGKCERAILTALAQYPDGRTLAQIAVLTGYSVGSGGFNNSLAKLRTNEFITRGGDPKITKAGLGELGDFNPLPTGRDLLNYWLPKLGKCEREIVGFLAQSYPGMLTSFEIAEATGYSPESGGFNNALSRLRTLELITRGQPIKASDHLFQ